MRPKYVVQTDENVDIHELSAEERRLVGRPDAYLVRGTGRASSGVAVATAETAPAYAQIPQAVDIERELAIQIRDRENNEVITAIELLSPTNKRPGGEREQYLAKRRQYFRSSAHFVEIDLLRGWPRMPLDDLPDCDSCIAVSRVELRPRVAVWPLRLRDRLPVIRIPLRAGDTEPDLDLQAVLHQVYDAWGFEDYIYAGTPQPPLHPEDAAWAASLIPPTFE